jgi:hypothetical protein
MKAVINYFAELLVVLKAIESHLREISLHTKSVSKCVATQHNNPRNSYIRVDRRDEY